MRGGRRSLAADGERRGVPRDGGAAGCRPGEGDARRPPPARNVILFLGDAAGLPTLHGASVHAYGRRRWLFLHTMPHLALAETSSASEWVTDSAAGMTAIVTGHKTHNGVVSQSDTAVRRKRDGEPLKTILELAEERGLSTGVVSNSSVLSATPGACYAHVIDRSNEVEVLRQLLKPRFGDGVDVVIGDGLADVNEAAAAAGLVARDALRAAGLTLYDTLAAVPPDARPRSSTPRSTWRPPPCAPSTCSHGTTRATSGERGPIPGGAPAGARARGPRATAGRSAETRFRTQPRAGERQYPGGRKGAAHPPRRVRHPEHRARPRGGRLPGRRGPSIGGAGLPTRGLGRGEGSVREVQTFSGQHKPEGVARATLGGKAVTVVMFDDSRFAVLR